MEIEQSYVSWASELVLEDLAMEGRILSSRKGQSPFPEGLVALALGRRNNLHGVTQRIIVFMLIRTSRSSYHSTMPNPLCLRLSRYCHRCPWCESVREHLPIPVDNGVHLYQY